jgi:hypothetical protein
MNTELTDFQRAALCSSYVALTAAMLATELRPPQIIQQERDRIGKTLGVPECVHTLEDGVAVALIRFAKWVEHEVGALPKFGVCDHCGASEIAPGQHYAVTKSGKRTVCHPCAQERGLVPP